MYLYEMMEKRAANFIKNPTKTIAQSSASFLKRFTKNTIQPANVAPVIKPSMPGIKKITQATSPKIQPLGISPK